MQIATTHRNTDFDALASVIAATVLHPDAVPILPKNVNRNVRDFINLHKHLFNIHTPDQIRMEEVDSLIVVDVSVWSRIEGVKTLRDRENLEIILWDHHSEKGDIEPSRGRREETGATITLMIREIEKKGLKITPIQASLFLMGLYEDTGGLTFPSTRADDAHAAGWLLERNADLSILGTFIRPKYGKKQRDILFEMVRTGERIKIKGAVVSINKFTIRGYVRGLALVVGMYMEVLNVDAAFGLFPHKGRDRCIVIGRARSDEIDVGAIMKQLGGGGHPGAGSAMLKTADPDAVEEKILELLEENNQKAVGVNDLMSFPVWSVHAGAPMETAAMLMREKGCSGFPVVDDDENLVGVISRRDFKKKIKKESQLQSPIKAFMQTNVKTVTAKNSPRRVANLMVKHDIGRLPVVKEGKIIGIITRSDIMVYLYDVLPV
ncbi:MAG: CBS domain-containing protein [Desulfobacterales bacterium]|nr:CBS domain-containing protein [Desulfobacterales bacterium]